ncbi:MAG: DUF4398 domain-containing protein [Spirochaetota bacterium]
MRRIFFYMVSLFLLSLFMVSCGGEAVPIVEMTEAKAAISKAEDYGAPRFATEKYNQAVGRLEDSHSYVKEGDLDRAKRRAEYAKSLAEEAMSEAAPRMIEDLAGQARDSIDRAIDVNAEVFAPQELQNAKTDLENAEQRMEEEQYNSAIELAQSSNATAQQAYNTSMGKKQLIRDAIMEVRQTLVTAQEYGAEQIEPDTFESAKNDLAAAVDTYRTDRLKDSYNNVRSAKEKADELFEIVIEEASQENLAQAQTQLNSAQESAGAADAQDELNAAAEMLETARSQHNDAQFRESIDSSNESMRLSSIVLETQAQPQEPAEQEEPEVAEGLVETDEYWVYEVQWRTGTPKDSLRLIAKRFYDDEMKWRHIYDANRDLIRNPDLIYPGWDLKVPKWDQPGGPVSEDASSSAPAEDTDAMDTEDDAMDDDDEMTDSADSTDEDDMMEEESDSMVEGEAPETSAEETVEVMPED